VKNILKLKLKLKIVAWTLMLDIVAIYFNFCGVLIKMLNHFILSEFIHVEVQFI